MSEVPVASGGGAAGQSDGLPGVALSGLPAVLPTAAEWNISCSWKHHEPRTGALWECTGIHIHPL